MILVTGASGQLGNTLQTLCTARGLTHTAVTRPQFDLANIDTIAECFAQIRPSIVINAAAYTAVDTAETDIPGATAGNQTGPEHLAKLCAGAKIPFIHVSTDYVFDGTKGAPYTETDPTNPTGVYGRTKRDGELAVQAACPNSIILRTSWVYSAHGKNFARTMLNAARKTNSLRVVADQCGTPTAADDLGATVLNLITKWKESGWHESYKGIYHVTGTGETTWYDFARAIFESAKSCGLAVPSVTPISTADWPTPAKRPPDSRLDCAKLARVFQETLPHWTASLPAIVAKLLAPENPA